MTTLQKASKNNPSGSDRPNYNPTGLGKRECSRIERSTYYIQRLAIWPKALSKHRKNLFRLIRLKNGLYLKISKWGYRVCDCLVKIKN
jgi:hypothetical protein